MHFLTAVLVFSSQTPQFIDRVRALRISAFFYIFEYLHKSSHMFTDARTIFVDLHNMFAKVRFAIRSQSVSDVHRPSLSFRRSTQQTFANVRRCLQMIRNSSQLYSAGFDKCLQILPDIRNKFTVFGRFSQNFR